MTEEPLRCPGCGAAYPSSERFCPSCGLPLGYALGARYDADERHVRARKVKPQLAEGEPVRVTGARNQAEAEFIQSLLLEEGVPSIVRRSAGFDVPDFLAAGPRDVLVPVSGLATARQVLLQAEIISPQAPSSVATSPAHLLLALIAALVIGALVVWLLGRL